MSNNLSVHCSVQQPGTPHDGCGVVQIVADVQRGIAGSPGEVHAPGTSEMPATAANVRSVGLPCSHLRRVMLQQTRL